MKKLALLLFVIVPVACVTSPPGGGPGVQGELDGLMEHWITSLRDENIDAFMEAYWPEAEKVIVQPGGREMVLRGLDEIRANQLETFERLDVFRELEISEPEREFHGDTAVYHYRVQGPGVFYVEHFEFVRREGRWAIMHQAIEMQPEGPPEGMTEEGEPPRVASDFQGWADGNRNGILEPPELRDFLEAVRRLIQEPHPVRSPVDEFFDRDRNGEIDHHEMITARNTIFREQLRRIYRYDADLARIFDLDGNGRINLWEIEPFIDLLFVPESRQPREAGGPVEKRVDRNRDGFADQEEFDSFARQLFALAPLLPLQPQGEDKAVVEKEDVFAYVDLDSSGRLEPPEEQDLVFIVQETILSPPGHPVRTPLDAFFDRNRDARIDLAEIERARTQLREAALSRLLEIEPELVRELIDRNRNNRIDEEEAEPVFGRIFGDPRFREPHPVEGPLDERLDRNRDGRVGPEELHELYSRLFRVAALTWLEAPAQRQERWAVRSVLDELTDLNGDGFVDPDESLVAAQSLRDAHRVENDFDRRIDFNSNGTVEIVEIMKARRAGNVISEESEEAARALPVATRIDAFLDVNGNRRVEEDEINSVIRFLREPERGSVPGRWRELLDLDGNGRISQEEVLEGRERYLRPHPVNPGFELDGRLDQNNNGFVEPEEIGIAAGFAAGRQIPSFDERLEELSWRQDRGVETAGTESEAKRFESEYYKKLGLIQDRKLAVVGITSGTKNVDEETAGGVMVFIENAFVNVGKVRVVDRQNIAKIVTEYEFQQSDLTDEHTAVEIGKLSGADIIVIGSISYVGKQYYLNIKLISVETAEIIGSSIAGAADATEFYEMCNEAVYKLF